MITQFVDYAIKSRVSESHGILKIVRNWDWVPGIHVGSISNEAKGKFMTHTQKEGP
jgi:hypothetical protein